MSTLLERLHHIPIRECKEAADAIIALQIENALLQATISAQRRQADRLIQQVAEALAMTRHATKATQ